MHSFCFFDDNPNPADVLAELGRILTSPVFSGSRRFRAFLKFIVEETLAGRGDKLKAYTIAVEVFGRTEDFDPQADPVVRVEATRLRGKLDSYYAEHSTGSQVKIELPKGGYRPTFRYQPQSGRILPTTATAHTTKPTVLVLPFTNLSQEKGIEQLTRCLSDEIALGLLRFSDFSIIKIPPSQAFRQMTDPPWAQARAFGARFILEGNVQHIAQVLRIRVSLIDVHTGKSLWAEKFDKTYAENDHFTILDEISARIIMLVGGGFGFINQFLTKETMLKPVSELETFESILRYHNWANTLNFERGEEAEQALKHAIAAEPGYALPLAMLSDLYSRQYLWGYEATPNLLLTAYDLAVQALDKDLTCQHCQWAWAHCLYLHRDRNQFLKIARKAIATNHYNYNLLALAGFKICMLGNWDEGLELIGRGDRLGLNIPGWAYVSKALRHYLDGNYSEALSKAKLITTPGFPGGHMLRAAIYGRMGLKSEGAAELTELLDINSRYGRETPELLSRIFFQDYHVEMLLQGLQAAGLALE